MKRFKINVKLKKVIKQSSYKKSEICKYLGIKRFDLLRYLLGITMPALDTFANLCVLLDVDANEMLGITAAEKDENDK